MNDSNIKLTDNLDEDILEDYINRPILAAPLINEIVEKNFQNEANIFIPGKFFPALSVTGDSCDLHCEHCNISYLSHMKDVSSERNLRDALDSLVRNGAGGCLISGGCDESGKVPVLNFLDILIEYKKKTQLIFNFHIGLLNEEEIKRLALIPPDVVSFDFTLDEEIITDIYHLNKNSGDYISCLDTLLKHNIRVVPHITIGLNLGSIKKEIEALKLLSKYSFDLIVFLILIPPNNKDQFTEPKPKEISKVFTAARLLFPNTELSLGCMRPRGTIRKEIEDAAINAGINRFEIPLNRSIKQLKEKGRKINKFYSCCAIPLDLYRPISE
jgi:uncharacterized radical SAM superfamily protein